MQPELNAYSGDASQIVLQLPAADMLRQRWNPFYSHIEQRVLEFMVLKKPWEASEMPLPR